MSCGSQLQYTIQFMNTGNDTAHNIYVMDTLSNNIDLNSLEVVWASAVMNMSVFNDGTHNIAKFDFPHINLLDSSHRDNCTGDVIFNIKTKAPLSMGTAIDNHAGIFFDDNGVVMTNTVENTIAEGCPTSVAAIHNKKDASIYPNPATNELTIRTEGAQYNTYSIINSIGQVVGQGAINTTITTVNVKMLPAGVYSVLLTNSGGTTVKRFVKM